MINTQFYPVTFFFNWESAFSHYAYNAFALFEHQGTKTIQLMKLKHPDQRALLSGDHILSWRFALAKTDSPIALNCKNQNALYVLWLHYNSSKTSTDHGNWAFYPNLGLSFCYKAQSIFQYIFQSAFKIQVRYCLFMQKKSGAEFIHLFIYF